MDWHVVQGKVGGLSSPPPPGREIVIVWCYLEHCICDRTRRPTVVASK